MFFPQFLIFGILFLIVFPNIMIFISNLYFNITGKRSWFYWFKISLDYDDVFTIIIIEPLFFLMLEIGIFCGYYKILFNLPKIIVGIIFALILGIMAPLFQIMVRKIFGIK